MTPALLNDDISPQSYLRDQLQEKDQRSKIREEILEQRLKDDKKGEITYLQVRTIRLLISLIPNLLSF